LQQVLIEERSGGIRPHWMEFWFIVLFQFNCSNFVLIIWNAVFRKWTHTPHYLVPNSTITKMYRTTTYIRAACWIHTVWKVRINMYIIHNSITVWFVGTE
jgi:hypothetical protein